MDKVYFAARWDKGTADYINCPFTKEEYDRFLDALTTAEAVPAKDWEQIPTASPGKRVILSGVAKPRSRRTPKVPISPTLSTSFQPLLLRFTSPQNSNTSKAASPSKRPPAEAATPSASAP